MGTEGKAGKGKELGGGAYMEGKGQEQGRATHGALEWETVHLVGILAASGPGRVRRRVGGGLTCLSLDWQDKASPTCVTCQPSPAFFHLFIRRAQE